MVQYSHDDKLLYKLIKSFTLCSETIWSLIETVSLWNSWSLFPNFWSVVLDVLFMDMTEKLGATWCIETKAPDEQETLEMGILCCHLGSWTCTQPGIPPTLVQIARCGETRVLLLYCIPGILPQKRPQKLSSAMKGYMLTVCTKENDLPISADNSKCLAQSRTASGLKILQL